MTAGEHDVTLMSRVRCHLCEDAHAVVERVCAELGVPLTVTDVDTDPLLRAAYGDRVPVLLVDGAEHGHFRVDEHRLRRALAR
ncbi:MAG: glutaredoxin family protein [Actinobacteria bacterium]|nr:glutaredoxin family protein [Actinomycetota bacterium]MBI3685987.1 glutaredoxin family protein [Actinomycetota bacterium]